MSRASTTPGSSDGTTNMTSAVPERLTSDINMGWLHPERRVNIGETTFSVDELLDGCIDAIDQVATDENGVPVSINKTLAVSAVCEHLTTHCNSWFSHEFDQDTLEDLFWSSDDGGSGLLNSGQPNATDYIDPLSKQDVDEIVIPLVGLTLTHGDPQPDTEPQQGGASEPHTADAQRAIKQVIIEQARAGNLDESELDGAVEAAKRDLRQL